MELAGFSHIRQWSIWRSWIALGGFSAALSRSSFAIDRLGSYWYLEIYCTVFGTFRSRKDNPPGISLSTNHNFFLSLSFSSFAGSQEPYKGEGLFAQAIVTATWPCITREYQYL
jgi:hypothetical protein